LVREQIRVASGEGLTCTQEQVTLHGHAIECRINAEDPETFAPSPGLVKNYVAPGGMHVRVDSGLYTGYKVPPYYDSMIGKLIVYGSNRDSCIRRLKRALEEFVVEGMKTTIPLHQKLVRDEEFLAGEYTIKWLEQWLARPQPAEQRLVHAAVHCVMTDQRLHGSKQAPDSEQGGGAHDIKPGERDFPTAASPQPWSGCAHRQRSPGAFTYCRQT